MDTTGTTSTTSTTSTTVGTTSTVGIITGAPSTTETKFLDVSLGQKPPGSSVVSKSTTSSKRADETRSETGKKETFSCSPQKNETVRDVLRELGRILKRCDPPMWKHILLLNSGDCMFAFRAVVVLLCRELPATETVFLWETLMARRDFETSDGGRDEDEERKDSRGSIQKNDPGSIPGECGDGTLFLHVVAAAFINSRHLVFACAESDDLLNASHHAVRARMTSSAALVQAATKLMQRV